VTPEASAQPTAPARPTPHEPPPSGSTREEIHEFMKEQTGYEGRSLAETSGYAPSERAALGAEIVGAGGRLDRLEQHHTVFVFVLRAIQARRAGRSARSVTGAGSEGFRQIVDDLFPQQLVGLEQMRHDDLHRALNDTLDRLLEPARVVDLIARRGPPAGFGPGSRVVERGGARAMMERLQHVTELELVDIVEDAYRQVNLEHPGLLSPEMMEQVLREIARVRQGLQRGGQ
jgi:hypothetical protein